MDLGQIVASDRPAKEILVGDLDDLSLNAGSLGSSSILHPSVQLAESHSWSERFNRVRARLRGIRHMSFTNRDSRPDVVDLMEQGMDGTIHQEFSPEIVYQNICMEDDPPVSVAISPAKQCVAFGCKTGVELYWVCTLVLQVKSCLIPFTDICMIGRSGEWPESQ